MVTCSCSPRKLIQLTLLSPLYKEKRGLVHVTCPLRSGRAHVPTQLSLTPKPVLSLRVHKSQPNTKATHSPQQRWDLGQKHSPRERVSQDPPRPLARHHLTSPNDPPTLDSKPNEKECLTPLEVPSTPTLCTPPSHAEFIPEQNFIGEDRAGRRVGPSAEGGGEPQEHPLPHLFSRLC